MKKKEEDEEWLAVWDEDSHIISLELLHKKRN